MTNSKVERLFGWGHAPVQDCISFRPEKIRDLAPLLQTQPTMIARGLGRSYGDASLQPEGTVRTERLNHFLAFDTTQGYVRARAGVTLAELMDLAIPKGWFPPVIPGTRHVTLGGAFACNIHGKNHWRDGDFAEHVHSIRLMLPTGQSVECSPGENSELFWATAGGMGMTGIIEEVTLQLKPLASASLRTTTYCVTSLEDMVAAFEHYRESSDYMVGWIDHMAKGDAIGRGVFEAASHMAPTDGGAPLSNFLPQKTKFTVPFFMPGFLLNRYSMAYYNKRRFGRYSPERSVEIAGLQGFFHPLDAIGQWNRLYGKRGFFQYQCVFPETGNVVSQMRTFLSAIHSKNLFSFLAVIKYHRDGRGPLTFSKRGYSIALDFPNTRRVRAILPKLDRWVAENGGRVYLAKDATLSAPLFSQMYGEQGAKWQSFIRSIDPNNKFTSMMSERLHWKHDAAESEA